MYQSHKSNNINEITIDNGENIFDKKLMANEFCTFFSNIGGNLARKIKPTNKKFNKKTILRNY